MKGLFKHIILLWLTVGAGLCGCGHGDVEAGLGAAELMMEERPDSALSVLNGLKNNKMNGEERARYALLLSQAYDKNYIDVTDDSLISVARNYYAESDDSYRRMLAEYYHARVKMNGNDLHSAMMSALECEKIAKKSKDFLNSSRVQSMLSIIYAKTNNNEKALEYAQKDLMNLRLANKEEWEAETLMNIAYDYLALRRFEDAIAYVDSARALGEVSDHKDLMILIDSYVWLGQDESADSVYGIAEKIGMNLAPPEYAYIALANHRLGNQTKCDSLMKRAFSNIKTKQDSIDVYATWYRISLSKGNHKEALRAHLVVSYYTNEAFDEATENSIHLVQVENEKLHAAQQAAADEIRLLKAVATIAVLTLALVLICVLAVYLRRKYLHKIAERDSKIKERDHQIEERNLQIAQHESRWNIFTEEYHRLKKDSEFLQQKITDLNENLQELRQKEEFAEFTWTENLGDIYLQAKNTKSAQHAVFKKMEIIFAEIKGKKTKNKLESIINTGQNNLIQRLREECPKLNDAEINLLIYSGAGFSTRMLAEIFEKSENAIYNQKHRIREKIEKFYPEKLPEINHVI